MTHAAGSWMARIEHGITYLQTHPLYTGALLVLGVAVVGIIYWYLQRRKVVRKEAIQVHDVLRDVKKNLRNAREEYDSRTQWEFQEEGSKEAMKTLMNRVSDLEEKSDRRLYELKKKHAEELDEIQETVNDWSSEGPDYFNKDDFVQDVKHVLDILKRW